MSRIVVGVSGGIAGYKAVSLVRTLSQAGHDVHVVPTEAALRFVGKPTWEAISHNPVTTDLFDDVAQVRHVALGQSADVIVVAPATANTLAKIANGLADDLLGTTILASRAPLVLAPAMHTEMWENPATQANIARLRERGAQIVGPASGPLTGSDVGVGRMAEPEDIAAAVVAQLEPTTRDLDGLTVLISAGGTVEAIDPVRYLGNHSSGKQGVAIAQAARERGAQVTLVLGAHDVQPPAGVTVVAATTAEDLASKLRTAQSSADIVIMAAAVADYRPATVATEKLRKAEQGETLSLELVANPDILRSLVESRSSGQIIVGFAAETGPTDAAVIAHGRAKLARKGCDLLVVNRVGPDQSGTDRVFGGDTNHVHILSASTASERDVAGSKLSVAHAILDEAIGLRETN